MIIKALFTSEYDKIKGRPYIYKDYNRNTLILFRYALTPTGKISKYYATIKFHNPDTNRDFINKKFINNDFWQLPKLDKGYTWSNIFVYSDKNLNIS